MNHEKLKEGINVLPMIKEVAMQWHLFEANTGRQRNIPCQRETQTIELITYDRNIPHRGPGGPEECVETNHFKNFPRIREFFGWFTATYAGDVKRIAIVHLPENGKVYPHIDAGDYYKNKDRFHLVLSGYYNYIVNDETMLYSAGDLVTFDNKSMHSAENASPIPRVVVIFDVAKFNKTVT